MPSLPEPIPNPEPPGAGRVVAVGGLFLLSGAAGLVLQVVWMYRLGLVFGNAAYATAATLAAFFLGLAIGGWFWGNAAARFRRPLTVYGLMELGVAFTAFLWLQGLNLYEANYSSILSVIGSQGSALVLWKVVLSTALLLLPAALMGGTFPVLVQYVGSGWHRLARRGTLLYGLNTLGASLGTFFAGFFFLSAYGVGLTYSLTIALIAGIGLAAIILDRLPHGTAGVAGGTSLRSARRKPRTISHPTLDRSRTAVIAFGSGLLALAAETLWTRMFAQVLQNSVYSFSAILVVFLVALGIGGLLAHLAVRLSLPPLPVLAGLLAVGALGVGLSPVIFYGQTDGLQYLASGADWVEYLEAVFRLSFLVVLPPTVVIGAVFPFLLKASSAPESNPGQFVGRLVLFNSLGGTVGPILAGFVMLDAVGLWTSIKIVAVAYCALAVFVAASSDDRKTVRWMLVPAAGVVLALAWVSPPAVRLEAGENVLSAWQSSDGVVSVVESSGNIQMRLDNNYVLGDSRSALVEQMQAHVPMLPHPSPKNLLFLGMGTGITAGAALGHDVERVVAVELIANVVRAAKGYFSGQTNGLFVDPRVEIVADDARNFLLGTQEEFDVIVGDLFTPWHAGTGSLYTVENFLQAKKRLAPGGLFAQWLPLYQLTPESFETIAATFASVYPVVTLWRADFSGTRSSIALIGQEEGARLSNEVLRRNIVGIVGERDPSSDEVTDHMTGLFYLGNLKALEGQLEGVELNTDDRRTVEFNSPKSSQRANSGRGTYIVGEEFGRLLSELSAGLPAELDPYLSELPATEIRYVEVGRLYYRHLLMKAEGRDSEADSLLYRIQSLAPEFLGDQGRS
jgi:spermidine synthase